MSDSCHDLVARLPPGPERFQGGEEFTIQVRALPSDIPLHQRLKRLLKLLLRVFEFRCTRVEETSPTQRNET
jgi:hypothetical protein